MPEHVQLPPGPLGERIVEAMQGIGRTGRLGSVFWQEPVGAWEPVHQVADRTGLFLELIAECGELLEVHESLERAAESFGEQAEQPLVELGHPVGLDLLVGVQQADHLRASDQRGDDVSTIRRWRT